MTAQATTSWKYQTNVNVDQKYGGGELGYQFRATARPSWCSSRHSEGDAARGHDEVPFATGARGSSSPYKKLLTEKCGANEPWSVKNDYPSGGKMMTLGEGIAKLINTVLPSSSSTSARYVRDVMTKMGLHKGNGKPIDPYISDITLGSGTTNPMSRERLTRPSRRAASTAKRFRSPDHHVRQEGDQGSGPQCSRSSPPTSPTVWTNCSRARSTSARPTACGWSNASRPAAGKTGTTEGHNQALFVGYTKQPRPRSGPGPQAREQVRQALLAERQALRRYGGLISQVFGDRVGADVGQAHARRVRGMPVKDFPVRRHPQATTPTSPASSAAVSRARRTASRRPAPAGRRSLGEVSSGLQAGRGETTRRVWMPGSKIGLDASMSSALPAATGAHPGAAAVPAAEPGSEAETLSKTKGELLVVGAGPSAGGQHLLDDGGHPAAVGASGHLHPERPS